MRSEEHTSELQSHSDLVCRLLLEKKKDTFHSSVSCVCDRFRIFFFIDATPTEIYTLSYTTLFRSGMVNVMRVTMSRLRLAGKFGLSCLACPADKNQRQQCSQPTSAPTVPAASHEIGRAHV